MKNYFDSDNRNDLIKILKQANFDLLVIGGGITGAGIVLDAASRGLNVALIEKNDFASGTSSKSTKLIHGGLRYLKQFEIALVHEVGQERAVVHKLAPHLVKSEKMLLPLIKDGTYGKILASLGLMVYDVLAGVEKADQRKMLSVEETIDKEPLLNPEMLEGGGIYAEYRTDDARLTIEVLKTAVKMGAKVINYAEAVEFLYNADNKINGIVWKDNLNGEEHTLKTKYVISAAGPWVDTIREKNKSLSGKHLHLSKGVHIVVAHSKFPVHQSVYFDVPDGRMLFAIPRDRVTYIGTTDTDYHGDLDDVRTSMEDVLYLINGVKHIFPDINLSIEDVESSWAGLRPLIEEEGKSASQLSRKDEIFESETGLLSIAGGKLTGYRKMSERIIDRLAKHLESDYNLEIGKCKTDQIVLTGGVFQDSKEVRKYESQVRDKILSLGLSDYYATYLVSNYGKQTDDIFKIHSTIQNSEAEIRLALSELQFAIHQESVHTAVDFFERRTGRLYFNIKSIYKLIDPVMDYMKTHFSWTDEREKQERSWLNNVLKRASEFV